MRTTPLLIVALLAVASCSDTTSEAQPSTTTPGPVICDAVSPDVQAIGDGLEVTEWVQLSMPETLGGYNSIVQARGPGGNYTWAVEQSNGTITGLTASLDAATEAASNFPWNEPGTGGGNALAMEEVLATDAVAAIQTCTLG